MDKDLEKAIIRAVKNGIEALITEQGVDMVSDMVHDNPNWWAEEAHRLVHLSIDEACKSKELIEEVVKEYLTEMEVDDIVHNMIAERLDSLITPELILKAAKDAMKGE